MSQKIIKGIQLLAEEARQVVEDVSVEEAKKLYQNDAYVFVDVREAEERKKHGVIPRTFTCPRGMLEFLIDPKCPVHNEVFNQNKTYVFYCAHGLRSLYAAKQAFEMGLSQVKNLSGGFANWEELGGEVEPGR
ncbi:rhodanese-like domain-containing protein [Amphritea sp.]|uniref:rhodanese-like domain-containing protein n=1 Tax=Amphritea sp. TaxID=1872502 RepID=UPI003A95AD07